MQYLALIYAEEGRAEDHSPEIMEEYGKFTQDIIAKGIFKGGDALQPTANATTVRVRDGKTQVTDGPFAETKEALGGYYLLECDTLDQAVEVASRIPTAKFGSVEVRPIHVFE